MSVRDIRKYNDNDLLIDIKKVSDVMVYSSSTCEYFSTTERELLKRAETTKITYKISDRVFRNRRVVMVIY